jgi:penicillin-binding protein 1C
VIDRQTGYELCSRCWDGKEKKDTVLLVYPAASAEILRKKGFAADIMPSHLSSCTAVRKKKSNISIEYPTDGITVFIPRSLDESYQQVVCKASSQTESSLLWYLDGKFLGETHDFHNMAILCNPGKHILSVFDNEGGEKRVNFRVVGRNTIVKNGD